MQFWRWARKREEVDEEVASHLTMAARDRVEQGETPEQADRAVRRGFGNVTLVSETTREVWTWRWLDQLLRDTRLSLRSIARNPGFAAVAILALSLGIGVNTAVFSVVNGVLLRPLPYPEPERLVWIHDGMTQSDRDGWPACVADFLLWRERARSFQQLAAYNATRFNLTGDGEAEQISGADVTAQFFEILGARPIEGRTFAASEDAPGATLTVVISERLWNRRYARNPQTIGKTIELNGRHFTVIGVMPATFRFRPTETDAWRIYTLNPPTRRGPFFLRGIARLRPGVTLEQANAEMSALGREVERADPRGIDRAQYPVTPLLEDITGDVRPLLLVLTGAVGLVLLIAIFNVANLMLARATARQREMAIRLSIGAGRGQLVRQLLTESIVLALAGGAAGVALAYAGVRALRALAPPGLPRIEDIALDGTVLLFTALVSVISGVVFGLAPAFCAAGSNPSARLKDGGRGTEAAGSGRLRGTLVVMEVALSVILLAGAGLLIRSFTLLGKVHPGFHTPPDRLLTMQLLPTGAKYRERAQIAAYWNQVVQRVGQLPGVESASVTISLPPNRTIESDSFVIPGRTPREGGPVVPVLFVWPDYFRTLGIPLIRGRDFDSRDAFGSPVTIVSETLARRYFPGENPIGHRLQNSGPDSNNPLAEIVGVVADVKYQGLAQSSGPVYYLPAPVRPMYLTVKTRSDALGLLPAVRSEIRALDPNVPLASVASMAQAMRESVALPRFRSMLMAIFAAAALLLAAVGIYGVLAYSVQQRTQEIGIRMALGATAASVVRLMIGQGGRLALAGAVLGVAGALALVRVLEKMLFGVKPTDAATFTAAAALLLGVALLASYIPARRAARIDPVRALRQE